MSEPTVDDTTHLTINDHVIEVKTIVAAGMKHVSYSLKCDKEMDPPTVAVALYLMCHDICGKMQMQVDELVEGLVESDDSWH